jgi:hypothetical protein
MEISKTVDVNFGERLRTCNSDVHRKFICDFDEIIGAREPCELLSIPLNKMNPKNNNNNAGGWEKVHYVHHVHRRICGTK